MGGQQTGREADGQNGKRDLRFLVDSLDQRGQDDERRVRKDGDGNDIAGDGHCQACTLLADQFHRIIGHPVRTFGRVQIVAQHDAKNNDDADAFDRAGKATGDGADGVRAAHAAEHTHDQRRRQQRDECICLDFDTQDQKDRHSDHKNKFHWHNFSSREPFLTNCPRIFLFNLHFL